MAMPIPVSAPPMATPPPPMIGDPLTGTSDQLVRDPKTGLENQWYIFRCKLDQAWPQHDGNGVIIVDIDWALGPRTRISAKISILRTSITPMMDRQT